MFLFRHLKLCCQLKKKKKKKAAVLALCGSGQQEEIFYSMAATRVRLEENSYRLSWKEAEAFLFPAIVCVFRRGTTPLILFSYVLPGGTSMLSSFLFSFFFSLGDISSLRPFHFRFFFPLPINCLKYSTTEKWWGQRVMSLCNRRCSEASHSASLHVLK